MCYGFFFYFGGPNIVYISESGGTSLGVSYNIGDTFTVALTTHFVTSHN